MVDTPISNVNPDEVMEFIHTNKAKVADCDVDVKDAKRRIRAAKGPKPKKAVKENSESDLESDAEG